MNKTKADYQTLQSELDQILTELQRDDLSVDSALEYYRRGLELTRQLEVYLKTAENKINRLQAKPKADGS
jgi:exodeoxyribonuclease VII small subunit